MLKLIQRGVTMQTEQNKSNKRNELLNAAYELFTTIGFPNTTISKITDKAGVGKGTFYLYFTDKEDIRNALIVEKSALVLTTAIKFLRDEMEKTKNNISFTDKILYIVDYIIELFNNNPAFLKFISKYLSWGFISSIYLDSEKINPLTQFVDLIEKKEKVIINNPRLLLFTIIELVNSTCYNVILRQEPVSIEEYKPFLYNTIRLIINESIKNAA